MSYRAVWTCAVVVSCGIVLCLVLVYYRRVIFRFAAASKCPPGLPDCVGHCPAVGDLQLGILRAKSDVVRGSLEREVAERRCGDGDGKARYCCEKGTGEQIDQDFRGITH